MDDIRQTRPWFWILIAALAVLGIVALVVAISAGNESVNQKKLVDEATTQIKGEVAGLEEAVEAADEIQAESNELAEQNTKQINRQVAKAVEAGEGELHKVKRRVATLEGETGALDQKDEVLGNEVEKATGAQKELEAEVKELSVEVRELGRQVTRLEK